MLWVCLLLFAAAQGSGPDQTYREGLIALNRNDLSHARELLERASKAAPKRAEVWTALAETYWKLRLAPDAERAAAKAEQLASNDPDLLHALAFLFAKAGRYAHAAELEIRYAAKDPLAFKTVAQLRLQAGQPKQAIEAARQAILHENSAGIHALLAKALASDHRLPEAVTELREALGLEPYDEVRYFELAQALLASERFDEAIRVLQQGRRMFDNSAQIELALGVAYYGQRRFGDAVSSFLRTIELDPEVQQPYVFLGKMLDQASPRLPEVERKFTLWYAASPDDPLRNLLLAQVLSATGREPGRVEPLLRKALAADGALWQAHFELGTLLEKQRDFAEAEREFRRAAELKPGEASTHYRLARIYDRLGKSAEAEAERSIHQRLTAPSAIK